MLSYSNRDFNSILEDLKKQIPALTDQWTDQNKSDLGMVLLQTIAGISAMANFYIDKESNENFIGLAKESKNIESILELIGYKKPLRRCAMATLVIEVNASLEGANSRENDIVLPQFFPVFDKEKQIHCFLANEVRIRPTEFEKEVPIYQGQYRTKEFSNTVLTGYKFYLPSGTYADDFFKLVIDGTEWEKVPNAFLEIEGGKKYSLHRDAYDSHYILFTNNYEQFILADGTFRIDYVLTDGEVLIRPLTITNIDSSTVDEYGINYNSLLRVYNKDTFTGGFSETDPYLERAKLQRQLHVMNRLVTLEDYNNYVSTYPGVLDCEVSDISVKNTTNPKPYQIDIFVQCTTLEPMSTVFKDELLADIKAIQDFRNEVFLRDADIKEIDLNLKFTTKLSSVEVDYITSKVVDLIRVNYSDLRFKRAIMVDEILSLILRNIPEIYTIDILAPTYDIYPSIGEVLRVRDINVVGGVYTDEL